MTHEAGIEAAVRAGDDFPGMSCFVNSKQRNEKWVKTIIQAYLSASGMVLVPREPTYEMVARMDLSYLTSDEAKSSLKYILAAAPDPFKPNEPTHVLAEKRFPSGYEIARMEYEANKERQPKG